MLSAWASLPALLSCFILGLLAARARPFAFLTGRTGRFDAIDGLRGYLALGVLFHHFVITMQWAGGGQWTVFS